LNLRQNGAYAIDHVNDVRTGLPVEDDQNRRFAVRNPLVPQIFDRIDDLADIDQVHGLLRIRDTKFGKSRELAVDRTTIRALREYLRRRDRPVPTEPTAAVLTSAAGTRLIYCNVHLAFKRIVADAGLRPRSGACRPRAHDLRHTFAVNTVLDAYRAGVDIPPRLALLCTYLGHVNPGSTYWYLQAAPELLAVAAGHLERFEERAR
jgi:integrase